MEIPQEAKADQPGLRLFLLVAGIFLLIASIAFFKVSPPAQFYFTDYWEHLAVVRAFSIYGIHVTNPIYAIDAPSRQFTPYHLVLGLLSRYTHITPEFAMATGALVSSLIFVYGTWDFAVTYFQDRLAPAVMLGALLCGWGFVPRIWTGFH